MPVFGLRRLSNGVQAKLSGGRKARGSSSKPSPSTTSDDVISFPSVKFDDKEPRRSRPPPIFSVHGARKTEDGETPDTDPPSAWFRTRSPSDDEGLSTTTSVTDEGSVGPITPQLSPRHSEGGFLPPISSCEDLDEDAIVAPLSPTITNVLEEQFITPEAQSQEKQQENSTSTENEGEDDSQSQNLQSLMSRLPTELLIQIARYLDPCAAAYFCISNRELSRRLGPECYPALNEPENRVAKLQFLALMDASMPSHLLCHECATFHFRQPHSLRITRDALTKKPLINCPRSLYTSSARLTFDRKLKYSLAHSVMRSHRLGPGFGLPVSSLRHTWTTDVSAWTCASQWSHTLRALILNDHLIIRVTSSARVPPRLTASEQRLLLSTRDDYSAMYSTCPHWTHGAALASICKCALRHIPAGPQAHQPPSQCAECRPLRRCSECATEYLIEVKLREDKHHPDQFRHAIVVTRWTDLGDVTHPRDCEEWYAACESDPKWGEGRYSPFDERMRGKRSLRARFEIAEQVRRVHEGPALVLRQRRLWASERFMPWRDD